MPEPKRYVFFKGNDEISDMEVEEIMREQNMRYARPLSNPEVACKVAAIIASKFPHETISLYGLCEYYEPQVSIRKTPGKG